jgi:hypothetical protein
MSVNQYEAAEAIKRRSHVTADTVSLTAYPFDIH